MSVSKFTSSSGINDFNLNIQATNSTITFDAEKSQGSYSIASSSNDTSIDFYAYASDGSLAGYTANKSFTASRNFNKMVILGGTIGDVIGFTYKTTYATSQETAETTAGPYITGVSPSSLPNVNSTTTVTGGNFASGITATFYGSDALIYPAKSVVVGTPQSLIVTRPDVFPISSSPYTLVLSNPGVSDPTGSAANILSNAITAGVAPSWTTASGVIGVFSKNIPFSATVVATDADGGSSITYSVVSGYSLPAGLSLGSATGIINGTPTTSTGPVSVNLRATDSGGNYVDRSFTLSDSGPVWITTGSITSGQAPVSYSYQLSATDDSGVAPTYTLVSGTFPTGITLSSGGLLSGTPTTTGTYTFVIRATDANGTSTNSSTLTLLVGQALSVTAAGGIGGHSSSSGTLTSGGAGGTTVGSFSILPGTLIYYVVGNQGASATSARASGGGGGFSAVWYGNPDPALGTWIIGGGGGGGGNGSDTGSPTFFNGGAGGTSTSNYLTSKTGGVGGSGYNGGSAGGSGSNGGGSGGADGADNSGGGGGGGYGLGTGSGNQGTGAGAPSGAGGYPGAGGGGGGGSGGSQFRGDPGGGGGGGYVGGNGGTPGSSAGQGGSNFFINTTNGTISGATLISSTSGNNNGTGYLVINGTTYNYSGSVGSIQF